MFNKKFATIEVDLLDHHSIEGAISLINDETVDIRAWINIVGGLTMGNHLETNIYS